MSTATLEPGDVVSLFGLTIVVGNGFFALNDPDGLVTCEPSLLQPLPQPVAAGARRDGEIEESSPGVVFFRSPRFKRDVATAEIIIDPPPQLDDRDEMPLMMVLGPALTMGVASLFMGIFAVVNVISNNGRITQALPTLIMSLSMMTGMILWPILTRRHERRTEGRAREPKRQTKYRAYIDDKRARIEAERRSQSEILHENIVTARGVRAAHPRPRARTCGSARPATTTSSSSGWAWASASSTPTSSTRRASSPSRTTTCRTSCSPSPRSLRRCPTCRSRCRSLEHPVVGVIGDRALTRDLVRGIVMQLVALHSYDELKLVFIYDPAKLRTWEFTRWLPHTWSDDRSVRFVATTPERPARGSPRCSSRSWPPRGPRGRERPARRCSPHYVVFALDKELAGKSEFVGKDPRARRRHRAST